jgi:calcineurin-like phosphoesterase family protein
MEDTDATTGAYPDLEFDAIDFVTSDQHFGHARIIELTGRPYADVEEMNAAMIERWNRVVSAQDTVLRLGDLALGIRADTIPITRALNGRKLLIAGNHDVVSSVYRAKETTKAKDRQLLADAGWEILPEIVTGTRRGRRILAGHFPYEGDSHGPDRFAEARPVDRGLPLLHGHTHDPTCGPHGHEFHVGVDGNDFTPVSMGVIDQWLDTLGDRTEQEEHHG